MNTNRIIGALAMLAGLAPAFVAAAGPVLPQYAHDQSVGVASCASSLCHGAVEPWAGSRVLQNEYVTWSRSDKHARAYAVLLNERSREMARRLELPVPAHRADLCLDCHAHNVPAAQRDPGFVLSDGITCEACHGAAGRWLRSHVERGARDEDNVAQGLYPVNDDVARARLCLGCHFGNQRKLVTHRLMAAGHPRMSFELDTFMQIQPAHVRQRDGVEGRPLWDGVKIWAIGQALAVQERLEILGDPQRGRAGLFPELVLFDCHACHRRMSDGSYAGQRLGTGPGVVRLNDSSLLMVLQIARRVDPAGQSRLAQQVARMHRAMASGDDALVQVRSVHAALVQLVPRISAYRFSDADVRAMLLGLIDDAEQYGDYQGAEQAMMALQSVADFMVRRGALRAAAVAPGLRRLGTLLANDESYSAAAFGKALRELRASIDPGAQR